MENTSKAYFLLFFLQGIRMTGQVLSIFFAGREDENKFVPQHFAGSKR
jgi:hypothetical protein